MKLKWFLPMLIILMITSCAKDEILIPDDSPELSSRSIAILSKDMVKANAMKYLDAQGKRNAAQSNVISEMYPLEIVTPPGIDTAVIIQTPGVIDTIVNPDDEMVFAYVCNFQNEGGTMIMSAIQGLPETFAYIYEGNLDKDAVNDILNGNDNIKIKPGLDIFIESLVAWVNMQIDNPSYFDPTDDFNERTVYPNGRNGFCPVKWGQEDPYNDLCVNNRGEKCYTGCVATAVAQFMACHKYPDTYNTYPFDWDGMTLIPWQSPGSTFNRPIAHNVAYLMYILGLKDNLDMEYRPIGSKGSSSTIKNAMRTFQNLNYTEWGRHTTFNYNKVVNELKQHYPVLIRANRSGSSSGHCWILDGIIYCIKDKIQYDATGAHVTSSDTTYMFQCNWGWNGESDGEFISNAFIGRGANYDKNTEIVYGVRK